MGASVDIVRRPKKAHDASAPMLVVKFNKKTILRQPLNKPRVTLGRSRKCDITLDEANGVSRQHAHVLVVDGEVVVEDLGSRNGTYVNGMLISRRTLRPGDRIAIGRYRLHFRRKRMRTNDSEQAEGKIAELLRLWAPAAIVRAHDDCPLCHAERPAEDAVDTEDSATGEYPQAGNGQDDDAETALPRESTEKVPAGIADDVYDDDEGDVPDEEEIMAKVRRLVGLAADGDTNEAGSPSAGHNTRSKFLARKPQNKRKVSKRGKPRRRSRLGL